MSDSVQIKKLDMIGTIKEGVGIGVKNIASILVNIILFLLTCWIPYLNVGTAIGLSVGIVSKASKGEVIPMTEIFDPKYRKYMGEFFLTSGLMSVGLLAGLCFFIIPSIVIGIAWSLSLLLAVDKGKNPAEAISLSNKCTYGNKWRMFGIGFLVLVVVAILGAIFSNIPGINIILIIALVIFTIFINIGIQASIYKQLTEGV